MTHFDIYKLLEYAASVQFHKRNQGIYENVAVLVFRFEGCFFIFYFYFSFSLKMKKQHPGILRWSFV